MQESLVFLILWVGRLREDQLIYVETIENMFFYDMGPLSRTAFWLPGCGRFWWINELAHHAPRRREAYWIHTLQTVNPLNCFLQSIVIHSFIVYIQGVSSTCLYFHRYMFLNIFQRVQIAWQSLIALISISYVICSCPIWILEFFEYLYSSYISFLYSLSYNVHHYSVLIKFDAFIESFSFWLYSKYFFGACNSLGGGQFDPLYLA